MECTVRNERRSCRLTSPGYPGVYPRGIRYARSAAPSPLTRVRQSFERTVCQDNKPPEPANELQILLSYAESSLITMPKRSSRSNVFGEFYRADPEGRIFFEDKRDEILSSSRSSKITGASRAIALNTECRIRLDL